MTTLGLSLFNAVVVCSLWIHRWYWRNLISQIIERCMFFKSCLIITLNQAIFPPSHHPTPLPHKFKHVEFSLVKTQYKVSFLILSLFSFSPFISNPSGWRRPFSRIKHCLDHLVRYNEKQSSEISAIHYFLLNIEYLKSVLCFYTS